MIQREVFDWGVVLTTQPFATSKSLNTLTIRSEIGLPRSTRASMVKISFTGVTIVSPLDMTQAATWASAMQAIVAESRSVAAEMKSALKLAAVGKKPAKRKS